MREQNNAFLPASAGKITLNKGCFHHGNAEPAFIVSLSIQNEQS